jgi:hypothetical protein
MGSIGPIVLCSRVTNMVALTDPVTLRTVSLDAPAYWRTTFGALASQRQLVEYVVLDIEPLGPTNGKLQLAEAQVREALGRRWRRRDAGSAGRRGATACPPAVAPPPLHRLLAAAAAAAAPRPAHLPRRR